MIGNTCRSSLRALVVAGLVTSAATGAQADLASDLSNFWTRAGGAVNVSKPFAYEGQRAGYVTAGSLYMRVSPRNSAVANIQLPSVKAGCGGIDIFGGAFSFINAQELIAMMEAIMQNATGFAFELALESLSPTIQEVVAKLRALAQHVNNMNINSCEQGQLLTSAMWPKMANARQSICQTIGSYTGMFADRVKAKHECGTGGRTTSTLASATGPLAEQVPTNTNYAWAAMKKNAFLASNPAIAEIFMTMTGTVIMVEGANDDAPVQRKVIPPIALTPATTRVLVEGGTLRKLTCDENTKCLNPAHTNVTISANDALYRTVEDVVAAMSSAIANDTAIPPQAIALIGMTTVPIYRQLVIARSYKYEFVDDDISMMSELVAIDLAMVYLDEIVDEVLKSTAQLATIGDIAKEFEDSLRETKRALRQLRSSATEKYNAAVKNLQRLRITEVALSANSASKFSRMFTAGVDR